MKFKYKDKAIVINGFYEGLHGFVDVYECGAGDPDL